VKIAYFSPLPPQRTGVADYSMELLPALLKRAEIDLWIDRAVPVELPLNRAKFNYVERPELLRELVKYDAVIYQMGNSAAHGNIFPVLLKYPGIVVLHDFVLHHFLAGYYLEALRSPSAYVEEMAYNYGSEGEELAHSVLGGGVALWEHQATRYPLNKRVLDHARGVVVHSDFAGRMVRESHAHLPIAKVNLPVAISEAPADAAQLKSRYQIPPDRIVIGSFGARSSAKRTDLIARAVGALNRKDIIYLIVGEVGEDFRRSIQRPDLAGLVRTTGYVDAATFDDYCRLIDIAIDLRDQTMGESSAAVCRLLAAGKPCVVSNLGWFAEIPDGCAVKVDTAAGQDILLHCIAELIDDKRLRREVGGNARNYIRDRHGVEQAASGYIELINAVRDIERRRSAQHALVEATGRAMAEIGVAQDDDWLIGAIAREMASLFNRNFRFEPAIPARFLDQTALFGKGFIRFSSMVLSTAPELVDLASRGHATP
jgi:glycosyltransferase involved in cell wall biosynthesis